MKRLIEDAKKLVRLNSVSATGNEEAANFVSDLMKDRGLKVQMQQVMHAIEDISKRQFNVIGILGDPLVDKKTRKGLLLTSHLDTVAPGISENWTATGGDPFHATIADGKISGLGSADAKIDLLCKLKAVEKFREKKLKMPIYLVGSCAEEIGMVGARYLIKSISLNPKYVVVGVPSQLEVVNSHKGSMVYRASMGFQQVERDARGFNRRIDLYAFGTGGHAAYSEVGTNAIELIFDFLKTATENGFDLRFTHFEGGNCVNQIPDRAKAQFFLTSHQFEDFKRFFKEVIRAEGKEKNFRLEFGGLGDMGVRFLPDLLYSCITEVLSVYREFSQELSQQATLNSASAEGFGPPHSTIRLGIIRQGLSQIELLFDLRILPDASTDAIEKALSERLQKVAALFPNMNIAGSKSRVNPSLNTSPESDLVQLCLQAAEVSGITPRLQKKSTTTEAALYSQAGFEAVAFGPGISEGNSHGPNEYNSIDQIERAVVFYTRLIERVCL